mmetsp:Transcript_15801/g.49754  ORF Transcript_15801/g.49754 Transcript_15801/m.49754 type:complete len:458 (-) Transcript_15801:40-1413(-)
MDFDFDGLEEAEPAAMAQVSAMGDAAFRRFRHRLERAEEERCFQDFADAVAEAIWDEETVAERMPKIVKAFQYLLDQVAKRSPPDIEAGSAICYLLWQIGLSTSMQETRVRRQDDPDAPIVLVTGFGGSDVADLEGQAAWYHSRGFNVISSSKAGFPPVLRQKHYCIVARELRSMLREGSSVVLHLCSQYGVSFGCEILWMWARNLQPFDSLPSPKECLKAVVFDCAAPANFDPVSQTILYPTDQASVEELLGIAHHPAPVAEIEEDLPVWPPPTPEEPQKAAKVEAEAKPEEPRESLVHKSEDKFYLNVMLGCTGALTKKLQLTSLEEMVPANKEIKKCLLGAARYWRAPEPWVWKCNESIQDHAPRDCFAAMQWLDWAKGDAFPRLFLYSERDVLVTADRVEAFIRHTKKYRPEADIVEAKLKHSAHCRLWDTELDDCAAAVLKLLNIAGVPARS